MYILLLITLLSSIPLCDTIEDGWKGINPLKTDKTAVNKILGTPEIDDNGYYRYSLNDVFIRVNYSTEPCANNQYKRGRYNIQKDTVLNYYVVIKKPLKLSELKFQREKYNLDRSGDVLNFYNYVNEEEGIVIAIVNNDEIEYVNTIYFNPSKKTSESLICKN